MPYKILVVEDEKNLSRLYRDTLMEETFDVDTASNGRDALKKVAQQDIDLVVLDIALPDGSGVAFLEEFMKIKRQLKIVINTAYPREMFDFHTWAAEAFLVKSADLSELKQTIHRILSCN